jgi:Ni/Co efflux regulator RcnB
MKKLALMLLAVSFLLAGTLAADTSHPTPGTVKHKVHKRKPHKVVKHKTPKRTHNPI